MEIIAKRLARDGCDLPYWLAGPANAPLVVFTHGATIDHHEWDATWPLVCERWRVLLWDMRGHGASRPARFDFPAAVADLLALLDELQVPQAILVGHSLGGNLHQEFVFQHPTRVAALVFLGCTWNFQALSALEKLTLGLAGPIFNLYPYPELINQSVAISAATPAGRAILHTAMQRMTKAEFVQIMLAATTCLRPEPWHRIGKPLLMLMGDQEATGNIRQTMPRWAAHENSQLRIIPHAKHAANLDNPAAFHQALLEFLEANCADDTQAGSP